jgi:hypothetical protein
MDSWTERLMAHRRGRNERDDGPILPFYLAEPDKPELAARLGELSRVMKADLAAGRPGERLLPVGDLAPAAWPHQQPYADRGR